MKRITFIFFSLAFIFTTLISCNSNSKDHAESIKWMSEVTNVKFPDSTITLDFHNNHEWRMIAKLKIKESQFKQFCQANNLIGISLQEKKIWNNDLSLIFDIDDDLLRSTSFYLTTTNCNTGNHWRILADKISHSVWLEVIYPDMGGDIAPCNNNLDSTDQSKVKSYPLKINPRDESKNSPELHESILKLKKAITAADTLALFQLMDSNIVSSHGGAIYGYDGVKEVWRNRNLWMKLKQILSLGGVFDKDGKEFRLPYCQADRFFGEWDVEWYTAGVLTTQTTLLYLTPDSSSQAIDTLEYSIVETIDYNGLEPENGMIQITTIDEKQKGFVKYSEFYSTSDYMLIFELQDNGKWIINSFAPYD